MRLVLSEPLEFGIVVRFPRIPATGSPTDWK